MAETKLPPEVMKEIGRLSLEAKRLENECQHDIAATCIRKIPSLPRPTMLLTRSCKISGAWPNTSSAFMTQAAMARRLFRNP